MRQWFILSAVGRDRPGIVADLAQLVFDSDGNLEDSRMTILGNEFAAILLCSGTGESFGTQLAQGARRLEWEHRLTVFLRPLEGEPRPPVPAPGMKLYRVQAQGEDRAGIVARTCRTLANHGANIADLRSEALPSPTGSHIYRMTLVAEVPDGLEPTDLAHELDRVGAELGLEISLAPA